DHINVFFGALNSAGCQSRCPVLGFSSGQDRIYPGPPEHESKAAVSDRNTSVRRKKSCHELLERGAYCRRAAVISNVGALPPEQKNSFHGNNSYCSRRSCAGGRLCCLSLQQPRALTPAC